MNYNEKDPHDQLDKFLNEVNNNWGEWQDGLCDVNEFVRRVTTDARHIFLSQKKG